MQLWQTLFLTYWRLYIKLRTVLARQSASIPLSQDNLSIWDNYQVPSSCISFLGYIFSFEMVYRPLYYSSQPFLCGILFLSGHLNNGLPRMKHNTQFWWIWDIDFYGAEPRLYILQNTSPGGTDALINFLWEREQWNPWGRPMCLSKDSADQSRTHCSHPWVLLFSEDGEEPPLLWPCPCFWAEHPCWWPFSAPGSKPSNILFPVLLSSLHPDSDTLSTSQ